MTVKGAISSENEPLNKEKKQKFAHPIFNYLAFNKVNA